MSRIVTLLTDFGGADPWVGAVKGVLYAQWARWPVETELPRVVDLGHEVPRGDIAAAAWFLEYAAPEYPPGTVHLAVVDPGVGGDRPALAIEAGGQFFVGPGNGLFKGILESARAGDGIPEPRLVRLDRELYRRAGGSGGVSATFHGRDVFAPAAAHLAMGAPLEQIGTPVGPETVGSVPGEGFPPGSGAAGHKYRIRWIDRGPSRGDNFGYLPGAVRDCDCKGLGVESPGIKEAHVDDLSGRFRAVVVAHRGRSRLRHDDKFTPVLFQLRHDNVVVGRMGD